ncbi:uncharacterized protein [Diadema setosum]|uniref:uncharacterized protein n=1 Tax=Diadema setosum TaxID=31175 RepID=UPI003B3A9ADC
MCDRNTEVCTETGSGFECQCRENYYNTGNGCTAVSSFQVMLEIETVNGTIAVFYDSLSDRSSHDFNFMKEEICTMVDTLYQSLSDYFLCDLFQFRSGSIIAETRIFLDVTTVITDVDLMTAIRAALRENNGSLSSNSSIFSVSNYDVTPTDECTLGLHDCSVHATCTDLAEDGYQCACSEGYQDVEGYAIGTHCKAGLSSPTKPPTTGEGAPQISNGPGTLILIITCVCLSALLGSVILFAVLARCFLQARRKQMMKVSFLDIVPHGGVSKTVDKQRLTDEGNYMCRSSIADEFADSSVASVSGHRSAPTDATPK